MVKFISSTILLVVLAFSAWGCAKQEDQTVDLTVERSPKISIADTRPVEIAISPTPTPTSSPTPTAKVEIKRAYPYLEFQQTVSAEYPEFPDNQVYVALKEGKIMAFADDSEANETILVLDISDRVSDVGMEEGLLGLAFDPLHEENGYFYVFYTASGPRRSVLSRFTIPLDDPSKALSDSEKVILEIDQPAENHNGGQIAFGPDDYLYVGVGDGGGAGDRYGNGQDTSTLLGTILRIDVNTVDTTGTYAIPEDNPFVGTNKGRPEIWAYGMRNPWRFTFDSDTGDLWAGDVGQNHYEEIDLVLPGLNYGWNVMEGFHCYPDENKLCSQEGMEPPIAEYPILATLGCSVIGGYVYRGNMIPQLYGKYVYGDFCSGRIWTLESKATGEWSKDELVDTALRIVSFTEDRSGEMIVIAWIPGAPKGQDSGLYRVIPAENP